ncbi:hypothetical protein B0T14DRAFT_1402 [Immersiella caudata]|uniref:Uncharacterized protein n=1 Tax=Immersiella caudata TaxID=314043 RepID=A0AA39XDD1_9PEZI|nr:hypothetical protein B0T14DRAFT_1402 [Immersiella caudata]
MEYISKRPAPTMAPGNVIEHTVALSSSIAPIPFPSPEAPWQTRDVSHEDWRVFSEQLLPKSTQSLDKPTATDGESEAAFQRCINCVVEEWNAKFFKPRGLRVKIDFGEKKAEDGPHGLGFKWGNTFVGISKNSGGVGLMLPGGVLVGVATKNKAQGEEKK